MKARSAFLALAACLALGACGGASKAPEASGGGATDKIGVAECDEYITKYEACVNSKVPESARPMVKQALDQNRAAWKQAAANPQAKSSLATGCKAALDGARTSMSAYGCTW